MAEQGDFDPPNAPQIGPPSSPESSLTWCLAHLSIPEHHHSQTECRGGDRASQWKALVAIRTQHIHGDNAKIAKFRCRGGLRPLLDLLKRPKCSRKTLDLALSILANCCTEQETRVEVRKLDGINIVVEILKRNVGLETVQNRAARALGNLAMDPESSALIHSAGGVPLLLLCVCLSSVPPSPSAAPPKEPCPKLECAQSAARALLYLCNTAANRMSLLTQGALSALAPLIAPEFPQALRRAALRTLHELTRGCSVECAREVSRSGVLAQLGVMATEESGKPYQELALKTLANLCTQGCLRPLVGSLGVIQKFTDEVKKDPRKAGVFLQALCLCCKEAVNRAKVKESGGLEVLTGFLSAQRGHPLAWLPVLACVEFVFDEAAMEQLQELGLVPLLVARLVQLTRGEESAQKMDVSLLAGMSPSELQTSPCFDSFDFPPPDGSKKEDAGKEQGSASFLSLRSWLVSEGLISSEEDLLDSSAVDGEWAGLHMTPSSFPQTSSPNPYSSFSPKNSVTSPVAATPKKPACKVTDSPLSTSPPSGSSSSKTLQTPVIPSKFSSPHRKSHSAASLTKLSLDTPPSAPRTPAYHHPYHPEPWTPESPILLLLSRFSHDVDPSAALISWGVMSGLLLYVTQHRDPSSMCFRMLCRLSCNPNCLQALVRTGSVALIHLLLCQQGAREGEERQEDRVRAKVKQLGVSLLNSLGVQCESSFGSGVLAHIMLSGSEADKMNGALSLPLITSNKSLLKKLLLDSGGLQLALQPLGYRDDHHAECGRFTYDLFNSAHSGLNLQQHSALYFSVLSGCLSALGASVRSGLDQKRPIARRALARTGNLLPPPSKKPRLADSCPYALSSFDLFLTLDDGTRIPANREAVGGVEGEKGVGSEYFRVLLRGGFGEAQRDPEEDIVIKDVSAGMLVPVLHYLHGCHLTEAEGGASRGRCHVLEALMLNGLRFFQSENSDQDLSFQQTSLGESMMGASRFLVDALRSDLEDACTSLLLCCSSKLDQDCSDAAEENLAVQTSALELTGTERLAETEQKKVNNPPQETENQRLTPKITRRIDRNASVSKSADEPSRSDETTPKKNVSAQPGKTAREGGGASSAVLPQVYWFCQRHSYPSLRRACLWALLGCQDCPKLLSSAAATADCLRRLAREADCTETLKRDLLGLAAAALS